MIPSVNFVIDANSFLTGVLIGLFIGVALGIGCAWRYWKHRLQQEIFDKSRWN